MRLVERLSRIIGALLLAALLGACSAVKLGYNALPDISYWWLDGYADFTAEQQPRVREALARLQQWHRQTELPRYAALLQRMEQLAPGEVTPQKVCGLVADVRGHVAALAQRPLPDVVTVALTLSPAQVAHLARQYASRDEDYRREWVDVTPALLHERRWRRLVDRSEMIYGTLGEPQRELLRQRVAVSVFDARQLQAERDRRHQDLLRRLRLLTGAPDMPPAQAGRLLQEWLATALEPPPGAYRQQFDALLQENCETFAALHNSTTPTQRESAVRRLRAYQRDLRELAAAR